MSIFDLKYLAGGLEKEERKRALSDEELQGKISGLIDKRKYLVETKIPALKGTPDYEPAIKELQEIHTGLREAYDHKTNPGAIQKFGHLLTDHLGIKVTDSNSEGLGIKGKDYYFTKTEVLEECIKKLPLWIKIIKNF